MMMEDENAKKIFDARKLLQTILGWMAHQMANAVNEYKEPVEEKWLETKQIILNFLGAFAERNGYE